MAEDGFIKSAAAVKAELKRLEQELQQADARGDRRAALNILSQHARSAEAVHEGVAASPAPRPGPSPRRLELGSLSGAAVPGRLRTLSTRLALALLLAAACARAATPVVAPEPVRQQTAAAPDARTELPPALSAERLRRVRTYIASAWQTLTRSNRQLPEAAIDPKFPLPPDAPLPVYVAADEDRAAIQAELALLLPPIRLARIDLRSLPRSAPQAVQPPGLLYLPSPYVVPGGRFNEMYGWDSYFIVLGLLRDGHVALAREQTENFLYQVSRYGKVLNANRSYYLTRSQPPLLSGMVRAVFQRTGDRNWLAGAREALINTHRFWTSPPHLAGDTGLSRYFDVGQGPAPEVVSSERDAQGRTHYERARAYYRSTPVTAYDVRRFYDRERDRLTPLFYVGDRSMRESGFDPSERWGPFGVAIIDYAPVCLNVLLAVLETDLAAIDAQLGNPAGERKFLALARQRRERIDRYLWDPAAGLYFDWDVHAGRRRPYPFATTFWPLWAGLASVEQAARVRANLVMFERPGGVLTSTHESGNQWDAPFGWAPLQLFAALGLQRAGFSQDARRVAGAFLSLVAEDFQRRGNIVEKYDVERRTSQVESRIRFGYSENVVGFGWTNGVFLELLARLFPEEERASR